jgi:hypothetical protein
MPQDLGEHVDASFAQGQIVAATLTPREMRGQPEGDTSCRAVTTGFPSAEPDGRAEPGFAMYDDGAGWGDSGPDSKGVRWGVTSRPTRQA